MISSEVGKALNAVKRMCIEGTCGSCPFNFQFADGETICTLKGTPSEWVLDEKETK